MKAIAASRRPYDEETGISGTGDEERVSFLGYIIDSATTSTATMSSRNRKKRNDASTTVVDDDSDDSSTTETLDYMDVLHADDEERKASHGERVCWSFRVVLSLSMLCVSTIAILLHLVPSTSLSQSTSSSSQKRNYDDDDNNNSNGQIHYECPASVGPTAGDSEENFEKDYTSVTRQITTNITEFKETFRTTEYDGWGRSFDTVKEKSYDFKSKYFPMHLKNGSSIYESACGIGLNLLMTLEILEEYGITDIVMFGNEYVAESADKANWILSEIGPPGNGQVGKICPGDSTNLSFVPSNTMDLVYTGYITPVIDPLHLDVGNDDYDEYKSICNMVKNKTGGDNDWMGVKLNEYVQVEQERWYGQWVGEMTRIAKPGSPILIEQVSPSYCTKTSDWGGVDREYWNRTATLNTYGWNVDSSSIEIVDDQIFRKRYNVFMMTRN
mmetsp:Transcript_29986/g.72753  ORF Transcript_29986/g.72753 Transcript_29986/m.72753 type:complete len:442 (-) Transcript_29986:1459-2784(-)